ncbi:AfsR/SARP family transcriptional regulator [Nocardiopsis rhodophaea]|uniref:AfsR/SARP family transcriptional regulator n=1 Tax=Nocardiopsis rhodophaea TaxID=280238 RepID=UPI0031DB27BA
MIARVLGPLRVTVGDVPVVPTPLKAKKLLALLVLNRDRVVQRATIERELWGLDVPMSSSTGIQNCVMQIRKCLGQAQERDSASPLPKKVLITEPTGYRLAVPGDHFDVSRHRGLVAAAGRAEAGGDLAEASAQLNNALSLWRDAPLADVPAGPVLQSHVLRLEEERKSILMQRVALDLQLRRYTEVIGELHALAALSPYDEVLYEYLILALCLSGRRNDALSVYQELRVAMIDELGLEPSPRLRSLQQQVLSCDAGFDEALEQRVSGRAELVRT